MDERSMAYIRSVRKFADYVKGSHVCLMFVAMKENLGFDMSDMPLVAEAVEYGSLDYLIRVATGDHHSQPVIDRAGQVLLFVRSHLSGVNHG